MHTIRYYEIGDFPHSKVTLVHQSNNRLISLERGRKEKEKDHFPQPQPKKKKLNYKAYSIWIFRLPGFSKKPTISKYIYYAYLTKVPWFSNTKDSKLYRQDFVP